MKRVRGVWIVVLVGVMVAAMMGVQRAHADEKEYKSTARLTKLIDKMRLSGLPGEEANVLIAEMPGGWLGGKHYHSGHVFVYVLKGSITFTFDNKKPLTVKAGEVYHEMPGEKMLARNASASKDLKLLIFQVGPQDKPIMIKAD